LRDEKARHLRARAARFVALYLGGLGVKLDRHLREFVRGRALPCFVIVLR
jgi:hypothetical protein